MSKEEKKVVDMRKTGGEVDLIVYSLIEHANDKAAAVQGTISRSLIELSHQRPELVVTGIAAYISKRSDRIDYTHRCQLLQILLRVLETARDTISSEVAHDIIRFAAYEMTATSEAKNDWQTPSCQILASLSQKYPDAVIDSLLEKFKPGVEPHYYVINCLSEVAQANPGRFALRLREVINRVIPVLGLIKKSASKWVFATALGHMAESIQYFEQNADEASKMHVQASHFETDFASAWDVAFSRWIDGEVPRVKFAVLESLGYMSSVLSHADLAPRLPKLVNVYLTMYKEEAFSNHLPITLGMSRLLEKAVTDLNHFHNPLFFNQLLQGLQEVVCMIPDDETPNPQIFRNTNEILRCHVILCRALPEQTINFVINRFQIKLTAPRVAALITLTHFVNSLDSVLHERRSLIISSVTTLVNEQELPIRKALLNLTSAMATQGYLLLDGGETLIRFIVSQCALKPTPEGPPIKRAAEHRLIKLATREPSATPVMWPFLLEMVNVPAYTNAMSAVACAIYAITKAKQDAGDGTWVIDFNRFVNLPSPQAVMARFCILAALPFRQRGLGQNVCSAMITVGHSIHPALGEYWSSTVPALIEYLETNAPDAAHIPAGVTPPGFNLVKWQDTLLKVFRESVAAIGNEAWLDELANVLMAQYALYPKDPEAQRIIHRYLGTVLARISNRVVIQSGIDKMLSVVNHDSEVEQRGCAQGLGIAANPHLDYVLPKLTELLTTTPEHRKTSGFFGFGRKELGPEDTVKATVFLTYGYVTAYSNMETMASRLDVQILHNIMPSLTTDPASPKPKCQAIVRVHLAKAIDLIGKAVHPSRLPDSQKGFVLKRRDELIRGLLCMLDEKVTGEKTLPELKILVLDTISTLVALDPKPTTAILDPIFVTLRSLIAAIPTPAETGNTGSTGAAEGRGRSNSTATESKDAKQASASGEAPITADTIAASINALVTAIVTKDGTIECVLFVLKKLEPLFTHWKPSVRNRTVITALTALKQFIPCLTQDRNTAAASNVPGQLVKCLPELGKHLAAVMPRTGDAVETTRLAAAECIQALLYIDQILSSNPEDGIKPRPEIRALTEVKSRLSGAVAESRMGVINDLVTCIAAVITPGECVALAKAVITHYTDPCPLAAQSISSVISRLVELQSSEFKGEAQNVVSNILDTIKKVGGPSESKDAPPMPPAAAANIKEAAYSSLRTLARSHFDLVLQQLLKANTPFPDEVKDAFLALVHPSAGLAERTVTSLISAINDTPMDPKTACPVVMAATVAMSLILVEEAVRPIANEMAPQLISTLLMRTGTAQGVDGSTSSKQAIKALKTLLTTLNLYSVLEDGDSKECWSELDSEHYDDAITHLTKSLCIAKPEYRRGMLDFLNAFYSPQAYVGQRVVATTMLAEFINHASDDKSLQLELVKFLLARVADKVAKVRKQALRGLGNVASVWSSHLIGEATGIIFSLSGASEDTEAEVAAEAVKSLTQVVGVCESSIVEPTLMSICSRLRSSFDRKQAKIRAAGFKLFGELCRFGRRVENECKLADSRNSSFLEQMHTNLPLFVAHLNDEDAKVRAEVFTGFVKMSALLHPDIEKLCQDQGDELDRDDIDTFVLELSRHLAAHHGDVIRGYVDTSLTYFTSQWISIRQTACYFVACLLRFADESTRNKLNIKGTVSALVKMLSEEDVETRNKVARGLAALHEL